MPRRTYFIVEFQEADFAFPRHVASRLLLFLLELKKHVLDSSRDQTSGRIIVRVIQIGTRGAHCIGLAAACLAIAMRRELAYEIERDPRLTRE